MPTHALVANSERYSGNYVAKRSFKDKRVVSFGPDPVQVYEEAKQKGVRDPVVFFLPEKGVTQIYSCL